MIIKDDTRYTPSAVNNLGRRRRRTAKVAAVTVSLALFAAACGSTSSGPAATKKLTAKALYPNGVNLVVNQPPGGSLSNAAEVVQPYLQKYLGVRVTIDTIAGGGGITSAEEFSRYSGNAPYLYWSYYPTVAIGDVIAKSNYHANSWTPIYQVFGHNTDVVFVKAGSGVKSLNGLKALGQNRPVTAGMFGPGSSSVWFAMEYLSHVNQAHLAPVPFDTGNAVMEAVLSGAVQVGIVPGVLLQPDIQNGSVTPILQMSQSQDLKGVPTILQAGGNSKELVLERMGLEGPRGMTSNAVAVVAAAVSKVVTDKAFIKKAASEFDYVSAKDPNAYRSAINAAYQQVNDYVKSYG